MTEQDGRARAIRPGPAAFVRPLAGASLVVAQVALVMGAAGCGSPNLGRTPGSPAGARTSSPAGPTTYPPLVADASWTTREGERALVVRPTAYLREHTRTEVADEAWRWVVAAVPAADSPGMRHQFVCHVQFAASKDAWYLEPARPDVGYARTVAAGCNPGSPRDVG